MTELKQTAYPFLHNFFFNFGAGLVCGDTNCSMWPTFRKGRPHTKPAPKLFSHFTDKSPRSKPRRYFAEKIDKMNK